jgi:hypothetical protein
MRIDPKMTATRFICQILLGLFVCFLGYAGITYKGSPLNNLLGVGFFFIGGSLILQTIVFAIKGHPKDAQKGSAVESDESVRALLLKELKKEGVDVSIFNPECLKEIAQGCTEQANFASSTGEVFHTKFLEEIKLIAIVIGAVLSLYENNELTDNGSSIYAILKKHGVIK